MYAELDLIDFNYYFLCSVKWVGLFVILLAGVVTVKDLWDILGDLSLSMVNNIFPLTVHYHSDVLY